MNRVFVDFENVPNVDLDLIRDRPAEVTLLIGEKQRRLEMKLVRQIHALAAQVSLVEVGAAGRNALDLVLAWHLGHAAQSHPGDLFFVVSKDKDFDPLIKHLRARGLEVARVDAFSSLPFLAAPAAERRKAAAARPARVDSPTSSPKIEVPEQTAPRFDKEPRAEGVAGAEKAADDPRFAKLVDRLVHKTKSRPVRRKTLLSHVNAFYGKRLSPDDVETVVRWLEEEGIIAVDRNGRVAYPDNGG